MHTHQIKFIQKMIEDTLNIKVTLNENSPYHGTFTYMDMIFIFNVDKYLNVHLNSTKYDVNDFETFLNTLKDENQFVLEVSLTSQKMFFNFVELDEAIMIVGDCGEVLSFEPKVVDSTNYQRIVDSIKQSQANYEAKERELSVLHYQHLKSLFINVIDSFDDDNLTFVINEVRVKVRYECIECFYEEIEEPEVILSDVLTDVTHKIGKLVCPEMKP